MSTSLNINYMVLFCSFKSKYKWYNVKLKKIQK